MKVTTQLRAPVSMSQTLADRVVHGIMRHWLGLTLVALIIFSLGPFLAPVAMAAGWPKAGQLIYWFYSAFCHQLPQRSWFLFGDQLTYTVGEIHKAAPELSGWQLRFFNGTPAMGWKVAWSDRMISWYGMIPVFGVVYALLRQWGKAPRPISWRLFLWLLLPLVLDGGTHLLNDLVTMGSGTGFRDTNHWLMVLTGNAWPAFYAGDHLGTFNWWMRLMTGLLGAGAVVFWVFPWLDQWMTAELAREESKSVQASG